jgi:pimeloyl-ACP methyl ester carboxylesterase
VALPRAPVGRILHPWVPTCWRGRGEVCIRRGCCCSCCGRFIVSDRPTTRFVKQGDLRIAYQVVGEGPLDLVFPPGVPLPVDLMWEEPRLARFLRRLASFSRLVLFDYRSSGASILAAGVAAPTFEMWADDVRLVMDTVGIERAALVGWHVGALPLIFFAASQPERVSHLGLINGFARLLRDDDYPVGMPRSAVDSGANALLESYGTGADLSYHAPSLADDERFREWWARCERLWNVAPEMARQWRDYGNRDLRSVLPALRVPTLVLHHRGNRLIRVGNGRYLAEHIPGARYVELEGQDHLFFTQASDVLLDEIESFLTGSTHGFDADRVLAAVCSRTSSPRPTRPVSWAIGAGASCSTTTTRWSVPRYTDFAAG